MLNFHFSQVYIQREDVLFNRKFVFGADAAGTSVNMYDTMKLCFRDHCHERPPVLKDQIFLAEGPTCQCNN